MKYLILPVVRFIAMVLAYVIGYPLVMAATSINAFWHWDASIILTPKNSIWNYADEKREYVYLTPYDEFKHRKTKASEVINEGETKDL